MKRREKKNNKGFSLVELIVVIAIMIVLVAVLAPVFTKYVEQSRRATDVQNASSIAEAILVDVADGTTKFDDTVVALTNDNKPTGISKVPAVKGTAYDKDTKKFFVKYDKSKNEAEVYVGTAADTHSGNLLDEDQAKAYKNQ